MEIHKCYRCGRKMVAVYDENYNNFYLTCLGCYLLYGSGSDFTSEDKLVKDWNKGGTDGSSN